MAGRRFFIPGDRICDGIAVLTLDQAHHLRNVLRLKAGEEVELFDGEGLSFSGTIEYQGTTTQIGALKKLERTNPCMSTLVLAPAIIKADRFEWMLEKATELGVAQLIPIETRFTSIHIPEARLASRLARWRRIITEASKQCRRPTVPIIQAPLPWRDFLAIQEFATHAKIMLHEKAPEHLRTIPAIRDPVLLCVGPEGGWEDAEAHLAEQQGFHLVSMGSGILRAETAAIAAVSIVRFLAEG